MSNFTRAASPGGGAPKTGRGFIHRRRLSKVKPPATPGMAAAAEVRRAAILAWAWGERRKAVWSRPGRTTSSRYRPSPRRKRGSSRRGTAAPKYFAPMGGQERFLRSGTIQSSQGAATPMKSPGTATPAMKPRMARKRSEIRLRPRSASAFMRLLDLQDHLDLDRDAHGQAGHAHRRARVLADGLAEDLDHQVRTAVDDLGLVAEPLGGVHHAQDLHHARDPVEAAQRAARGGE